MKPTRRDYCQFLLSTQINYTQTYMSDHHQYFSHDAINRYLMADDVSPEAVWMAVKDTIRRSENACLIFDDTVLDKRHAFHIELVRRQYSGNEHGIIKGIGVVNCLYVNLDTGEHWIVDWRVYNPDADGKSKLDHMRDMFDDALGHKQLPFHSVLMDSWYAAKEAMLHIDRAGKIYYCPLKCNRLVDDSQGKNPYQAVADLGWYDDEMLRGKLVKIHEFPKDKKVKLFRVAATNRLGIRRHQRPFANLQRRRKIPVCRPLENRAIPSRGQTTTRNREMPVPLRPRPEEPHRLRDTRVELHDQTRQKIENQHLRHEKTTAIQIYEGGTKKPVNTHGSGLT